MDKEEQKLKRMNYLAEVIRKYVTTEPILDFKDLAEIIQEELDIKVKKTK